MEEYYLVFVVLEVLKGGKKSIHFCVVFEHVAENHDQRTLVDTIRNLVQGISRSGRFVAFGVVDQLVEVRQQQAVMGSTGFAIGVQVDLTVKKRKAESVALSLQQIHQRRTGQCRKTQFVDIRLLA
ncbi:MAG: hypothetical protein ACK57U_12030, partial [Planctomycetota bacterium]